MGKSNKTNIKKLISEKFNFEKSEEHGKTGAERRKSGIRQIKRI